MTLTRFVTKNAFRNKRRSILTVLSIAFSLLLLTLMMTIWRAFYSTRAALNRRNDWWCGTGCLYVHASRLTTGKRFAAIPGVVAVVPVSWFGGIYKDQKPENFFAQFGTDPEEFFKSLPRHADAGRSSQGMAARPPGRDRGRYAGEEIWMEAGRPHCFAGDDLSGESGVEHPRHLSLDSG